MPKFRIEVRDTTYYTYELDIPQEIVEAHENNGEAIEEYFYELVDQEKFLVDKDNFSWEITEVDEIKEH